ncbi:MULTISPECIES: glycoside hydrolase family 88 protein [Paenibacillus]|uniref:glycoside hydrolase family 88 protein n=1 Tax=Paenibacillus TaxID=44249 RepID=UPI000F6C88BA|nr:glycoside hydrolase family 88 protein [Paenibacillus sp. M-152]AZH29600.1 glycosyl hydrolase [Paenibacillus sp. M-152]MEE4569851.1 glycoside hydrolase family 88 protein [Paenibacillus polymyxa]
MTIKPDWVQEAWDQTKAKVKRISHRIGDAFPHASVNGEYQLERASWWTAGFWPGMMWLVYRDTKDTYLKEAAESCERQLDSLLTDSQMVDHDLGFMWTLTSGARYKLLGAEDSKRRTLLAANLLAARFNVQGNFIRAWNGENIAGWAIIDCLMNLPLLYWASSVTGDPRYKHIAVKHADTVLKHFYRPDGSVAHIVVFDPETGEKLEVKGGQGHAPESAWSRGTAWAIYGMSLSYHYTGNQQYLDAAKQAAHFFMANLPEDSVPYWDFRSPEAFLSIRDSSAGACAACGLLLIADQVSSQEAGMYRKSGERILHSLYTNYGAWESETEEGLILHGTSHFPEKKNVDVSLIYGDYYFAEGISLLMGNRERFW